MHCLRRLRRLGVIGVSLCILLPAAVHAASISFQHPANGSTVSGPGNIELRLTIDDPNNEIRSVEYSIPGIRQPQQGVLVSSVPIGTSRSAPFTYEWPSVYGPMRKVIAEARNAAGVVVAGAATQFNVTGSPSIAPTVSLATPQDHDSFSLDQTIELRATASAFHGVSCVEFQEPRTVTPIVFPPIRIAYVCSPPYRVNWPSDGRNELRIQARVLDRLGNYTDSQIAQVTFGNQRPTVAIQSPANNSTVIPGAVVTITASASDPDNNLRYVEFRSGPTNHSSLYGRDDTFPYTVEVTAAQGGMTIYARAYDSHDFESLPASVTLVEATPPSVAITAPVPNTVLVTPASITYEATASTTSGTIAKVELFDYAPHLPSERLIGQATQIAGTNRYSFNWSNIPVGVYGVRARATSTTGAWKLSEYNFLSVNAPNQPPNITLLSPPNGSVYPAPTILTLSSQATDADGTVERVDFYNNGSTTAIASVPRAAATGSTFQTNWSAPGVGRYVITAKAFDNTGASSAVSAAATIDVAVAAARETLHFYHSDAQGSIIAVSDAAGQRVTSTNYRPFGQIAAGTGGNSPTRLGFTGKLRDTDLELSYFGARFYDPVYGRFVGLDPVDFHADNLQTFGRYAYANNSPYKYIDPDGREAACVSLGVSCFDSGGTFGEKLLAAGGMAALGGGVMAGGAFLSTAAMFGLRGATIIHTPEIVQAGVYGAEAVGVAAGVEGPVSELSYAFQAAKGRLRIDPNGTFSKSELNAAWYMAGTGKSVILRSPVGTRAEGRTSDLLVDGIPYDVYTPTTGNPNRIVSAIRDKNSQAQGIVLDLSESSVTRDQLGNLLERVNGAGGKNIQDIVIFGGN